MSDELKVITSANELQDYIFIISNKASLNLANKLKDKIDNKKENLDNKNNYQSINKEMYIYQLIYNNDIRLNITNAIINESIDLTKKLNIANGVYLDSYLKELGLEKRLSLQYECIGILSQINRYTEMLRNYELIEEKQMNHMAELLYKEQVLLIGWIKNTCERIRQERYKIKNKSNYNKTNSNNSNNINNDVNNRIKNE